MKLIVDIPEEVKEKFDNATKDDIYGNYYDYNSVIGNAIKNGTPLPKGHGRLGDLDIILNKARKHRESYMEAENSSYCRGKLHAYELYVEEVENAPTIIEADKENKGGTKNE